ncbi:hypothetical protein [Streptacidiphilus jiangxiensis]|uniref:Uncharacterized protein n=1 Tax=Streptacidiphilus jiangxiensis TaxID=235985 RepID=A0A1H7RH74_STRJI|nr:hypothetical protein [Streptacidiphilus jiangxiensis]SEL59532.1 hypothetical protein SAMN05414137_110131 [Streptacidiphilus jiangxiensis]
MTTPGPTTPGGTSAPSGLPGLGPAAPMSDDAQVADPKTVSMGVTQKTAWAPRANTVLSPEQKELDDLTDEELEALTQESVSKGVLGGASAIVSAALGVVSLSGTYLGTVIQQRQGVLGQIGAKTNADVIKNAYTEAWHRMAEWNGAFALVAVLVGAATLFGGSFLSSKEVPSWVKAVAWAGVVLGLIGLFVSASIWFDWFMSPIKAPATSATGG